MKNKLFLVLGAVIVAFSLSQLSCAQEEERQAANVPGNVVQEPVNAGNKICPVSGEIINSEENEGMTPITVEYEGKIYNLCCPACIDEFKKDPQKYITKVEAELKAGKEVPAKDAEK